MSFTKDFTLSIEFKEIFTVFMSSDLLFVVSYLQRQYYWVKKEKSMLKQYKFIKEKR